MNRLNGTRFLTQEELAEQLVEIDLNAESYPVGGIPLLAKENKVYVDAADSHTMIFGATGSKKTRMFAMPSIGIFARAGESFVVTDPKGELYKRTVGDVTAHGYKGYCLNLRDFKAGVTWNPLALLYRYYHNGKTAKAMEFINEMAKMIIGEDATGETFWTNTAIDVFCGFTLLLFERALENECNLKSLSELWNSYLKDRKKTIDLIRKEYAGTIVYQKIASLDCPSEKTVGSIETFITMGLNKLSINEDFVTFLSQEGMDLEKMTEQKTAIYLVIPDENTSYHFIVSLLLEQLYEVLIEKAQGEAEQKLPIRMNFLIDEFANIPKIENMESMITDIISGNCNNWIYLYSKEYELLQEISRLCGEVIYDNNVRMPLFSEFDLQHLNKEEGEAWVLAGRNCPCLSNLADIEAYPYPVVEPQEKQNQSWKKVNCYVLHNDKKQNYGWELSDVAKILDFYEDEEPEHWLVAVGPDGMIMAEAMFRKSMIDSKAAIGAMACGELAAKKLDPEYLEWYSASPDMEKRYRRICSWHPEKVYVTLDELGMEKFEKVAGMDECHSSSYKARTCSFKLVHKNEKTGGEEKVMLRESVKGYNGGVGAQYLFNIAFRKANAVLEDTEYEDRPWFYNAPKTSREGATVQQFYKKVSKSEGVYLMIEDWRNVV